jgi:preprotein translocase subunit YajC
MDLLPMLLLFGLLGLMMFFMSRRQRRAVQQQQELQASLTVGDKVMTTSGMHGTIVATTDDTIDLEIAPGVETTWVRAAIRDKLPDPDEFVDEVEDDDEVEEPESIIEDTVDEDEDEKAEVASDRGKKR